MALVNDPRGERDEGFTLIELLVVVMIISILSLIAIPTFINQRAVAADRSLQSDLRNVANTIESYLVGAGMYPAAVTSAGTVVTVGGTTQVITSGSLVADYVQNTLGTAYCVRMSRAPGEQPASQDWVYVSNRGGLQPVATTTCPLPAAF